jgi:hypothetical protein
MPPLTTGRTGFAAVSAGNYLFALGGRNSERTILDSVEWAGVIPGRSLSPWQPTSPMSVPRAALGAAAGNSYIYALGGFTCPNGTCNQDGSVLATVEQARLDLTTPVELRVVFLPLIGRAT